MKKVLLQLRVVHHLIRDHNMFALLRERRWFSYWFSTWRGGRGVKLWRLRPSRVEFRNGWEASPLFCLFRFQLSRFVVIFWSGIFVPFLVTLGTMLPNLLLVVVIEIFDLGNGFCSDRICKHRPITPCKSEEIRIRNQEIFTRKEFNGQTFVPCLSKVSMNTRFSSLVHFCF